MKPKLKPDLDLESIQADLIETVCYYYQGDISVRSLAKQFGISPMKARKILITGGCYSTELSTEIGELYKDGKTPGEIAVLLHTTTANVNSYLPYERIIYNMEERSVEADRQARYRDRRRAGIELTKPEKLPEFPKTRGKSLIVVAGKRLRAVLPNEVFDPGSDPLSRPVREKSETADLDADRMVWVAELAGSGRGTERKQRVILESVYSGFLVPLLLPLIPEAGGSAAGKAFRDAWDQAVVQAVQTGLTAFRMPENRIREYLDGAERTELIRGRSTASAEALEEWIRQKPEQETEDPEGFAVRMNVSARKFGNSALYRRVDDGVCRMLKLNDRELKEWMDVFYEPLRS